MLVKNQNLTKLKYNCPHLLSEPLTLDNHTILVFTCNGLGEAPAELQQKLAAKFLQLNLDANTHYPQPRML